MYLLKKIHFFSFLDKKLDYEKHLCNGLSVFQIEVEASTEIFLILKSFTMLKGLTMHSKILIFFICFLSILSFKTQAYGQGHQNVLCNDCGSVDMRKRAILNGQGDVHVVDLKRNKVHKYDK